MNSCPTAGCPSCRWYGLATDSKSRTGSRASQTEQRAQANDEIGSVGALFEVRWALRNRSLDNRVLVQRELSIGGPANDR